MTLTTDTTDVRRLAHELAQQKTLVEQLSTLNQELYERNLTVERELYVARQLQQSLLPARLPEEERRLEPGQDALNAPEHFSHCHYKSPTLCVRGVYLPCDALGGDLYDVIPFHHHDDHAIGIAVADVSGHGVPAGFVTAIFKAAFYRMTHTYEAPWDILHHLNNELSDIVKTGDYVTAFYGKLCSQDTGYRFDYTGAGHPYPLYFRASDGSIQRLKENGPPLIWIKDVPYPPGSVHLAPGDRLLIFTDGVTEMRNSQQALFGEDRLEQLFLTLCQTADPWPLDTLIQTLSDFTEGEPLADDLSVVLVEVS
jgi:serine phosphatase RsbU (regulator of sigma subunit)